MFTLNTRQKCPHCNTEGVMFTGNALNTDAGVRAPVECSYCGEMVVLKVGGLSEKMDTDQATNMFISTVINLDTRYDVWIDDSYPIVKDVETPPHCPERISDTFREALENLQRKKYETAIFLCGKTLDISTRSMDQSWKLEKRLKVLADKGKITADMASWAEEIRLDRNTAAHEDFVLSETDATDIVSFTEAFLTYMYSLPALIESRRAKRNKG